MTTTCDDVIVGVAYWFTLHLYGDVTVSTGALTEDNIFGHSQVHVVYDGK